MSGFKRKFNEDEDDFDDDFDMNDEDDQDMPISDDENENINSSTKRIKLGENDESLVESFDEKDISPAMWSRDQPPEVSNTENFPIQLLDCDYYLGKPLDKAEWPLMKGSTEGVVPILRVFGSTKEGRSILIHVHGFTPYFYVPAPPNFNAGDCGSFRESLNLAVAQSNPPGQLKDIKDFVKHVEIVQRSSIYGYKFGVLTDFLLIVVAVPRLVATVKRIVCDQGFSFSGSYKKLSPAYESNVPFELRLMVDLDIPGCGWVELKANQFKLRNKNIKRGSNAFTSHCQYEADIVYDQIIVHQPTEPQWMSIAPFRILSFDIECAGRRGKFPEPEIDPVITIGCALTVQGHDEPFCKIVFQLKSCALIPGVIVQTFDKEEDLLSAFRKFVIQSDPDLLIGYNMINFDLNYLLRRATTLKIDKFDFLGRLKDARTKIADKTFQSRAYGKRENKEITIQGRIQFDLMVAVQREYKLRSYTLNAVSAHFLGQQKEDVHHSIISDLQNGTEETRKRLAVYCLKDAILPQLLIDKLMFVINSIEMARVTGVPFSYLLTRGQQIKVVSQILRKSKQHKFIIPVMNKSGGEESYEGATVIDPKKGYYDEPIATLDFASLYPSIMMAHNLCYSTLLSTKDIAEMSPESYVRTPCGALFVKNTERRGILPEILDELIKARSLARKQIKEVSDPFIKAVLNGRQLALKISANSVYGFTGATRGQLPCLEISSSVTSFGRQMIEKTSQIVEEKYTIANGYAHNAEVIYGDTDSVMVKFGEQSVEESMKLGREAAAFVSQQFIKPIQLEFEKVYFPYLLMNKKRYAGLMWTEPGKWSKMDAKGIETVRRDNCGLVKNVVETCLHKILIERSVNGAIEYTKQIISDLLCNKLDLSLLVITKALGKSANSEEYTNKQAHVELAERMRLRDAASAPVVGDRVAYVIIQGAKNAPAYERAEDPIYVLDKNIPIDTQYYLHQQLENPLSRIFEPVLGDNCKSLLVGDHTRTVKVTTSAVSSMMKFAKVQLRCFGCKTPLKDSDKRSVCSSCLVREPELYSRQIQEVRDFELIYSKVWTECQRCQGSLHQEVLCSSRDCPIFYRRKKVQKELAEANTALERFSLDF